MQSMAKEVSRRKRICLHAHPAEKFWETASGPDKSKVIDKQKELVDPTLQCMEYTCALSRPRVETDKRFSFNL